MCEQRSGRAVNRSLYEVVRGELGPQWRGLSHVGHVPTLRPDLFVLMAARDRRDCRPCLLWTCEEEDSSHLIRNRPLIASEEQVQRFSVKATEGKHGFMHLREILVQALCK